MLKLMGLPFFFIEDLDRQTIQLDEDTSRHVVQVLRMLPGERLLLTDGKGNRSEAEIADANRKRCSVRLVHSTTAASPKNKVGIAISLVKNSGRFEWFLEKAAEIGVSEIIPLICDRTAKESFRYERMRSVLISAMLQSQQCWLPRLHQPLAFKEIGKLPGFEARYIAHCTENEKKQLSEVIAESPSHLMLIGPEGDFTSAEIEQALNSGFVPVALGQTRLRTETAGIVAATLLCIR